MKFRMFYVVTEFIQQNLQRGENAEELNKFLASVHVEHVSQSTVMTPDGNHLVTSVGVWYEVCGHFSYDS